MGGYLEQFPVDASASTCGQGACNDETGCDDQAFFNCMHQLRQQKAVRVNKLRMLAAKKAHAAKKVHAAKKAHAMHKKK